MDDDIVIAFHSNDALEIVTEKIKLDVETIQLPKLMGEPFLKIILVTLQQGVSQGPIWDPTENQSFWYHKGMLHSSPAQEINLSQI